jgi:hypothetical protein
MASTQAVPDIVEELADLFASCPSRERLLNYRPPQVVQQRARALLAKQGESWLTDEEKRELEEYLRAETLMRLIKARLRAPKVHAASLERPV